jgi:hypothetical protein
MKKIVKTGANVVDRVVKYYVSNIKFSIVFLARFKSHICN